MLISNRLLRFLNVPGLGLRRSMDGQMGRIRAAMLSLLQAHGGHAIQRTAQRVLFATDLEALWYLRQDVMAALSAVDGELAAQRQMKAINSLFEGCLRGSMAPRPHQHKT
jgi:hypothetical protein